MVIMSSAKMKAQSSLLNNGPATAMIQTAMIQGGPGLQTSPSPSPDPTHGVKAALEFLCGEIHNLHSDITDLQTLLRSNLPNHLFEDTEGDGVKSQEYASTPIGSSPVHLEVVAGINAVNRARDRINWLRQYVVV
jgi:hypothetical protein